MTLLLLVACDCPSPPIEPAPAGATPLDLVYSGVGAGGQDAPEFLDTTGGGTGPFTTAQVVTNQAEYLDAANPNETARFGTDACEAGGFDWTGESMLLVEAWWGSDCGETLSVTEAVVSGESTLITVAIGPQDMYNGCLDSPTLKYAAYSLPRFEYPPVQVTATEGG